LPRIGCSGWNYKSWKSRFYPDGLKTADWLRYYAGVFDTVEINSSFYRLPPPETFAGWRDQTPDAFLAAVKASRYLTHLKRLTDMGEPVRRFYERIDPLVRSPKLGPVLWQLPPNFPRNDERLATALDALPPGRHAFEFRHATWFVPETYDALCRHGVALVIADRPEIQSFQSYELTADFTFLRFHHGGGDGNYSHRHLGVWARRIEEWREQVDVYAYFNNDWAGFAVENGLWLRERLGA
jgi:uncharacterized protein YecE (DUF72 family)